MHTDCARLLPSLCRPPTMLLRCMAHQQAPSLSLSLTRDAPCHHPVYSAAGRRQLQRACIAVVAGNPACSVQESMRRKVADEWTRTMLLE
jgi:hypothetical protein